MPEPLTLIAGAAAVTAATTGWHMRRRALRAEAELVNLRRELVAERHAASHDPLTGLPNRRAFFRIGSALLADPERRPLTAVVLDLNDFKQINDRFGHAAGDHVLVTVAQRFAVFAGDNLIARLGGDEFAGLLHSPGPDRRWTERVARQLTETVGAPIILNSLTLRVGASVGLAPITSPVPLAEALCRADAAMYRKKSLTARTRPPRQLVEHAHPVDA
ncbi:GGDEF domain-containing protein [Micromonospora echinofusca]|uniref:Diguanylate cyclase n=1 Tax=Micromonospora echinofusca TaxID=47858 RepID=A0ABS3VQT0_MICEH|nr:GGDEF domain-containing protein [Micromonospora echinofusca]MBO4206894.1 diguanylate cyclase [Micromonospora echinofusca]